ncbi:MAG TPA: hypothetical protein VD865_14750 [Stenotrophomonas sp.]|nr:hypothetical protein [Stenotrophomonas sp.]
MYAIKGHHYRAISSAADLTDGEVLASEVPQDLQQPDPVAATKVLISQLLDRVVQAKGYDNIVSCVSYVGDPDPQFDAEARAARAWRSAVYRAGYEILANVPEGVTTPEQVLALLPEANAFGWVE